MAEKSYATPMALGVRGTDAWREWVHRLAEHARERNLNELVDAALAGHARKLGFREPPPPRVPTARRKKSG